MSFISDIVKKGMDLKSIVEGISTLTISVAKLAISVENLSKMVQAQDMLLAELYTMQIHILKSEDDIDSDVPEIKFVEKTNRKTEKPN